MPSKPLLIGITGGIGSGKSTVCKVWELLGAKTYYADDRARWLMQHSPPLVEDIKALFGEHAYQGDVLNRKLIADLVFKNQELLSQLNALVHPAVARDTAEWAVRNSHCSLLLKEAALLFETGSYKELHETVLVTAPEEARIHRVAQRDPYRSSQDVADIMSRQWTDDEKRKYTPLEIVNDHRSSLISQVHALHMQFQRSA